MKTYLNIIAIAIAISTSSCLPPASRGVARSSFSQPGAPQPGAPLPGAQASVPFDVFYQELAPYGTWMNNPQYGQVWLPNVGRNFQPYVTRGHWVMTEFGNTWVSHYDWGWAPFHYGRWFLDNRYGWMWVPGGEWGPAWVAWRSGGGYYGWAPLSPGLNVNVNINIGRRIPRGYWSFVPQHYITSPRLYDYCVPRRRVVNVINQTTVINNTYVHNDQHRYYSGPRRRDIERVTRRTVPVRRVQVARRPGAATVRGGSVAMYRPEVRRRGGTRDTNVNTNRSPRGATRNNSLTRSPYRREDRSAPAVRSSRRDNATTRSQDSRRSSQPARQRATPSRSASPRTVTPSRSSSGNRSYERRSAPARTEQRSRSSAPARSVSPSRSRNSSSRSSSFSRPSSSPTRSATPSTRSSSRSRSSASSSSSSRSSTTRSAPSRSRSETRTTSPSRSTGRSRSGVTRSGVTRSGVTRSSRPQQ